MPMMTTAAVPTSEIVRNKVLLLHRSLCDRHEPAKTNKKTATGESPITTRPKLRGAGMTMTPDFPDSVSRGLATHIPEAGEDNLQADGGLRLGLQTQVKTDCLEDSL
jgi:hypothetical protein